MTQTSITYNDLWAGERITFQTTDNAETGTGHFRTRVRTGIVKSIGPKAATVVNLPGTPTWRAIIRKAAWDVRQVRREEPTPREIDTALAAIYKRRTEANRALARAIDEAHRTVGDRRTLGTRRNCVSQWKRSDEDVEGDIHKLAISEAPKPWALYDPAKTSARINEARAELARCDNEQRPLDAVYDASPWSRFFLVTSSDGHIHRSMHCPSCRATTEYGWLPELSGLTEADAVAAHGQLLCSVCFPAAPVEWTAGRPKAPSCRGVPDPNVKSVRTGMNTYHRCTCGYVALVRADGSLRKHKPEK